MRSTARHYSRLLLALLAAATLLTPRLLAVDYSDAAVYPDLSAAGVFLFADDNTLKVFGFTQVKIPNGSITLACGVSIPRKSTSKTPPPLTTLPADGGESQVKGTSSTGKSVGNVQIGSTAFNFSASEWTPPQASSPRTPSMSHPAPLGPSPSCPNSPTPPSP